MQRLPTLRRFDQALGATITKLPVTGASGEGALVMRSQGQRVEGLDCFWAGMSFSFFLWYHSNDSQFIALNVSILHIIATNIFCLKIQLSQACYFLHAFACNLEDEHPSQTRSPGCVYQRAARATQFDLIFQYLSMFWKRARLKYLLDRDRFAPKEANSLKLF